VKIRRIRVDQRAIGLHNSSRINSEQLSRNQKTRQDNRTNRIACPSCYPVKKIWPQKGKILKN
jgi:hypothetical protein